MSFNQNYIPYYFDNSIEIGILLFCTFIGLVAVLRGRKRSLPVARLWRRAGIAAGCALAGFVFYSAYILKRQAVEQAHHMTFGEPR